MENIYFFEETIKKDVEQAIRSRDFKNLRIKMIDCKQLASQRTGYFIYLRGRSEFLDRAENILKNLAVEKLMGDEWKAAVTEFHLYH